jgi:hypothetical protein
VTKLKKILTFSTGIELSFVTAMALLSVEMARIRLHNFRTKPTQ